MCFLSVDNRLAAPPSKYDTGDWLHCSASHILLHKKKTAKKKSLQDPFTAVLKKLDITDAFVCNWLNLLCFLLQGMPSSGTTTAVMAYMIADWCRPVSHDR